MAEHFGTDHHERIFTAETVVDVLPDGGRCPRRALRRRLDPADVRPLAVHARVRHVALGGDGSDELLAGYPTFAAERVAGLYAMPRLLHERVVAPLVDRLPVSTTDFSLDFKLKRFLRGAAAPADVRHATWLGSFTPDEQLALLDRETVDPLASSGASSRRHRGRADPSA